MTPLKILTLPRFEPEGEASGPPEYALTLPVPGPDGPGKFVLLTLSPDGRSAAILVDAVNANDRTVIGYVGDEEVVTIPKEAPWMLLKRELMKFVTKAEARRALAESYRSLGLTDVGEGTCPVHGAPAEIVRVDGEPARDPSTGQYL